MADVEFTRRDMLEIEKVTGVPAGALFKTYEGETHPTGTFLLAAEYVAQKKSGDTDLSWDAWLDEDDETVVVEVDPT